MFVCLLLSVEPPTHLLDTGSVPRNSPARCPDIVDTDRVLDSGFHLHVPPASALVKDSERPLLLLAYRIHNEGAGYIQ